MGKLESNKKQKKEALLNTAFKLFTSKGLEKTSISDIVEAAGMGKGTFYLYFSDKYDLRNYLISHKASQVFSKAYSALEQTDIISFEDKIIFLADNILNQFNEHKSLLTFISKNLSWGIFINAISSDNNNSNINFYEVYQQLLARAEHTYDSVSYTHLGKILYIRAHFHIVRNLYLL